MICDIQLWLESWIDAAVIMINGFSMARRTKEKSLSNGAEKKQKRKERESLRQGCERVWRRTEFQGLRKWRSETMDLFRLKHVLGKLPFLWEMMVLCLEDVHDIWHKGGWCGRKVAYTRACHLKVDFIVRGELA